MAVVVLAAVVVEVEAEVLVVVAVEGLVVVEVAVVEMAVEAEFWAGRRPGPEA